jgi:UDP-N-acetylglucosamine 2-epimerase (non-hydrolysing)
VAHVEAGLRSFDTTMPEELNRVVTDHLSSLLFVTEESGIENLRREGIADERVHLVGNVMIDTLLRHRVAAERLDMPRRFGLGAREYALLTLHRPSNVDDPGVFERLLQALARIGRDLPILFPVHPRTRPALSRSSVAAEMVRQNVLRPIDPLGYLEFLGLMAASRVALTDSGGVQEETTVLGVPCLTLRENTERPVTITSGTNRLVGTDPGRIVDAWDQIRRGQTTAAVPALWDGRAAARIVAILGAAAAGEPAQAFSAAT